MSTKVKNKALSAIDLTAAQKAAQSYADCSHQIAKKEAAMNEAIQKARAKYEDVIKCWKDLQQQASETLELYAGQSRAGWEDKSIELSGVCIGFRTGKRAVQLNEGITAEDAIDNLKEARLNRFIRVKEELDKLALTKETKEFVINQLAESGISFGKSETFYIELKK